MRILHAADFHLDSAFAALPAEKARQRRREIRELPDRLADLVREEKVDLVLLPGDLFDGDRVFPETLERLKNALDRIECPVFIAPGNHDPYSRSSPYAKEEWPDNVHIFRSEELTGVELNEMNCTVYGAAFIDLHRTSEALADFAVPKDGRIHLLCLHGAVDEPGSEYGNLSRQQIAASGLDYLALGHVHRYSGAQQCGGSAWAYCGCPEGRGFDEPDDRGAVIAEVEKGSVKLRFVPLCRRRYRVLHADVTDCVPDEALERVMPATAAEDICRVIFTGEVGEEGVDLRAVEADWTSRCYELQLRDETRPAEDLWQRGGEDSLRGLFLKELRRRYEATTDEKERETIVSAVRFGLAAIDGRDFG